MLSFTCRVCCQQQQPRRVSGGQGSGQNRLGSFASERIMFRSGRRRKYFAVRKHAAGWRDGTDHRCEGKTLVIWKLAYI